MKYEISINIKNEEEMESVQSAARALQNSLRKEPRKNKQQISDINDALALLSPAPGSGVFYTKTNVSTLLLDDDDDDDDDDHLRDFLDVVMSIAANLVTVKAPA